MIFTVEVWYRHIIAGEQEKSFDVYDMDALNIHEAFRFIQFKYFKSRTKIPFSYERLINGKGDGNVYKPFKENIRNPDFDKPLSELEKEY